MTEPTIRDAIVSDIPSLHALVESAYRGEASRAGWTTEADLLDGQRTDAEDLASILSDPEQGMLTAWNGDALVGCILIARRGEGIGYFGMLSVSPLLQNAGLGRKLVRIAEQTMADRFGALRVRISVIPQRDTLIAWYERLGYVATGEALPFPYGDRRFGLPKREDLSFIVMEKTLR
ncbi:GNAT family N-acetyltransferase [Brevundimonas sp. GCM10030266]|uniref:GNAT family N-acetyltransferase n=1 Tax=Brevundimonas sp. GCM10030266 TaxID=3273386 RepID=UPI003614440B